jgi:hypothetical protein
VPASLVAPDAARRSLTFFALGGSGIRALEPLLHLCALGLGPRQLRVVLIDPDQSNAAVARSRSLLDLYRRVRDELARDGAPEDGYFRTEVVDALGGGSALWSPIADEEHLQDATFSVRADRELMVGRAAPLGALFDLLYADRVRRMDLTLGFRGVPSIGTVFMNRLREQLFFEQILTQQHADADAMFFTVGSVFGGTGAAALPVVGRALVDGLRSREGRNDIPGVAQHKVGAALLLPYFTLPTPTSHDAPDGGLRPEAAIFAQNAAAALPTYTGRDARYGGYYVLGDSEPRQQERNEVGGEAQANRSHYVELYAALAALDFTARGGERVDQPLPVFRTAAVASNNVRWSDLPLDDASRRRLMGGVVAAHTFLTLFRPDGGSRPGLDARLHGTTWMDTLGIRGTALQERSPLFDLLGRFFQRTWEWAGELGASSPSLEFVQRPGTPASRLRHDEAVGGRRPARRMRDTSEDGHEVFRHWNVASVRYGRTGFKGLLPVLREGSELFAAERFAETTTVA